LTIMGGMHEFERKLIHARCDEGIKRAMARTGERSASCRWICGRER
jgi:DNA invertase Pin-like site-specific DNA recombinase